MTVTVLNTKINEVENKIPNTSSLVKVENKTPNTNILVTTTVLNTKISEVENKIHNHDKYTTPPEFNKLTAEHFTARLKQANFDNKLTNSNRKMTSNKTKYLEVQKKLNSLITKDYNFFLGRI